MTRCSSDDVFDPIPQNPCVSEDEADRILECTTEKIGIRGKVADKLQAMEKEYCELKTRLVELCLKTGMYHEGSQIETFLTTQKALDWRAEGVTPEQRAEVEEGFARLMVLGYEMRTASVEAHLINQTGSAAFDERGRPIGFNHKTCKDLSFLAPSIPQLSADNVPNTLPALAVVLANVRHQIARATFNAVRDGRVKDEGEGWMVPNDEAQAEIDKLKEKETTLVEQMRALYKTKAPEVQGAP